MDTIRRTPDTAFDWRTLLHPASAYGHPDEVLADPDLTTAEKRAILSSWASDACAVDDAPGLRQSPGAETAVLFDDIVEALHLLDGEEPTPPRPGGKGARKPPWQRDRDGEGGLPQAA